jgi:hypothetical protein
MQHLKNARLHATTSHGVNPLIRSARLAAFLVLCLCLCLSLAWSSDTSASAADDCTTPNFSPPTIYNAGFMVRSIASDDFNGDGNADLVAVSSFGPNVSINGFLALYLGDGKGGLPAIGQFRVDRNVSPRSIATGDFDGDGKPDAVTANGDKRQGNALVFPNVGREIPLVWPGTGNVSSSVAVADFNSDGKPDVVVTSEDRNAVLVALGDGASHFSNFQTFSSGGLSPAHVAVRDFNGDGKPDLAVANRANGGNNVSIFLGDGTGNFGTATAYAAGASPSFIAPGDFNSDNKVDLAVLAHGGAQNISILFGDGAGAFSAPSQVSSGGTTAAGLVSADFNGDGNTDLAVANQQEGNVAILLSDGAGNFNLSSSPATGAASPSFIIAPDLNHDGKPDLVVGHESARTLTVLLNGCGATVPSLSFNSFRYAALETDNTITVTVIRSGSLTSAVTVNYATSDSNKAERPAESGSDYKATAGTLTFAEGEASKTFTIELVNDTLHEDDNIPEEFLVRLSNPTGGAVLGGLTEVGVAITDDDPLPRFSVNSVSVMEGDGRATLTVTRTNNVSSVGSVEYRTNDGDDFVNSCADASVTHSAYARCDFALTVGRLDFAAGESQKTFTIPIIDDAHDEGPENFSVSLWNANSGAFTFVTIEDDDAPGAPNPIFNTPFFVRQHYLDFLSREPEPSEPWSAILNNCPNPFNLDPNSASAACDRIRVSQSFLGSQEFGAKGFYVFRFYKLAFNRLPEYAEIISDMSFVAGATEAEVYARKAELSRLFTERSGFRNVYDSLSNSDFVATLLGRYQLAQITTPDPAQPDGTAKVTLTQAALITQLDSHALTRAQVFRAVADSDEVNAREFNNAFVAMQYYGYLRRKPEPAGYEAWLGVLQRGDIRTMVNGFVNSTEYRLRFGNPNQ